MFNKAWKEWAIDSFSKRDREASEAKSENDRRFKELWNAIKQSNQFTRTNLEFFHGINRLGERVVYLEKINALLLDRLGLEVKPTPAVPEGFELVEVGKKQSAPRG
jgi:hypothetical protein